MKAAGLLLILLSFGVGGVWFAHGMHLATLTQKLVETEVVDDFGDKEVKREWVKTFELGLDYAGPGGGGLFGLGAVLLFLNHRKQKKARLA